MTQTVLTQMETALLDIVNRMQSEHQADRSHQKQQIADLRQEMETQRSRIDQLEGQLAWQTQILTALQPLLGLSLPPKD